MERPEITADQAVQQAGITAGMYLSKAKQLIDAEFGKGFAKYHPDLVAAVISAQVSDFNSAATSDALYEIAEAISAS